MLDIIAIITFIIISFKIAKTAVQERDVFIEFGQPRTFAWLSLLFPFGPIIFMLTFARLGWIIAIALTALCYIPALVTAKARKKGDRFIFRV